MGWPGWVRSTREHVARTPARTISTSRRLRRDATEAEKRLWQALRQPPFKALHFRRQVPIGGHFVDFASHRAKLVIEVDGGQHGTDAGRRRDRERGRALARHGYKVLRIWNNDVLGNLEGALAVVAQALDDHPTPDPSPSRGGESCPSRVSAFRSGSGDE